MDYDSIKKQLDFMDFKIELLRILCKYGYYAAKAYYEEKFPNSKFEDFLNSIRK